MNILANEFNFYALDKPQQKMMKKKTAEKAALELENAGPATKPARKKFLGIF